MKLNIKIYIILLLIVVSTSCGNKTEEKGQKNPDEQTTEEKAHSEEEENQVELTDAQYASEGIELGKVKKRNLSGTIVVNGILDVPPQNLVSINARLGGFLVNTDLLQGSYVKKGQIVAVLENTEFITLQLNYLDLKSKTQFLELEYNRQEELNKENVSSAKVFQQTTADYNSVKAQLSGIKGKLSIVGINVEKLTSENISPRAVIRSPISGYVTEVNVNIGKYVGPTDVMFEIVNTEHLHAELTIFEKDVIKIKEGQKVKFTLSNGSTEYTASVYLIGREISADRTIRVHAHLDKEDKQFLPGMYIRAIVEIKENTVNALPDQAIVSSEGKKYIFIKDESSERTQEKEVDKDKEKSHRNEEAAHKEGGHNETNMKTFQMVEVKTGVTENGFTEVALPESFDITNAQVVTKGAYALISVKSNGGDGSHHH